MGSQVLKLLLTTWNFWLLSPSSSSELLLPSLVMAMAVTGTEDTVEATMVATEDTTTARGPLMLRLRLMLSPPPPLSPDTDTEDTEDTTTERGPLMLSPDMATAAMDTEDTAEDTTVMVMVMATDTTVEKFQKFMLIHQIRVQYK